MRQALASLLLLLSSLAAFAAQPFTGRVVRVVDGDTVTVETLGHIVTVRVFGIDCPEKNQPGGSHATWFTSQMVMGRTVQVAGHSTDRYSRVYAKFDPYDAEMEDLEAAARERRIGLWEAYNPVSAMGVAEDRSSTWQTENRAPLNISLPGGLRVQCTVSRSSGTPCRATDGSDR